MRLHACSWLALSSLICHSLAGATRPRYGGTLTVEDPQFETMFGSTLPVAVAETLVRVNSRGQIEPVLSVAWQHDPDYKQWRFSLRPRVTFHDGQALTAASAAPSLLEVLKQEYPDVSIEAGGQALLIKSAQPMPDLLNELASPEAAISRGSRIGTGPFRIAEADAQHATFTAFADYWGGRPYLDSVTFENSNPRGRADIVDIPVGPQRRIVPEGWTTWSSLPKTLVVIRGFDADVNLLKALALAIDRAPIASVLAQHKAEPAFGLLPQWLSGYAFLFQSAPDLARAKQIVAQLRPAPVSIEAPANDPFLRSVAERIALNARDAGIAIQVKPGGNLRLKKLTIASTDAFYDLLRLGAQLKLGPLPPEFDPAKPETLYQFERSSIEDRPIIPLIHLRESYAISPRVHFQPSRDQFSLHLEDCWIEP
jgi:peptide/nickel transport system substrate-binding protein